MTTYSTDSHEWRVLESVTEYETGWYDGGYTLVELPDGTEKRYYWAELPPAVVVVAVVEEPESLGLPEPEGESAEAGRSVVMVEQFRPAIEAVCYELPAGIVENDESYVEAGARELTEEVGIVADSVELLEDFWCSTGVLRHERGLVWAEGFSVGEQALDGSEHLEVRAVPVEAATELARSDAANDATLEGLLLAEAEGRL
jgi:ADP-ribose pyrophosphatase